MSHEWTMSGHVFLYILSYFLIFSFLCSFLSFLCVFFLFFSFLLSAFYVKHSHEDALLDKKLESEWEVKYMWELCQGAGKKQSSWGQSKLYETSILSQMINGVHYGIVSERFPTVQSSSAAMPPFSSERFRNCWFLPCREYPEQFITVQQQPFFFFLAPLD